MDADVAEESSRYDRLKILQLADAALLPEAAGDPETALQLLNSVG